MREGNDFSSCVRRAADSHFIRPRAERRASAGVGGARAADGGAPRSVLPAADGRDAGDAAGRVSDEERADVRRERHRFGRAAGDGVLVGVNGVFGMRLADMAGRAGGQVTKIERPWGEVFTVGEVKDALARVRPKVVAIVLAETSTGAWQPIEEIAAAVQDAGAMLILDTVTALCGIPVEIDKWQIDAVYSATQKCLSCPPGLAPVSFSDRAVEK